MPTIADVAKRAKVSLGTVSRVLNDKRNVNPETRRRVEQAIQELNYVPSHAARSLRSKQAFALALLVPDITNPFWTTVARGVEDSAQSSGYSVLLCNTDENPLKQSRYLDLVTSQQVDGVIVAPYDSDPDHLRKLRSLNTPTVIIDRRLEEWAVDTVYADSVAGAMALTQHLIDLGHRRIALIAGPAEATTSQDRIAGYSIALRRAGIPLDPKLTRSGEYRPASGRALTHQLFEEGAQPTAIFAANNAIAMGVLDALEERGLDVPQDIALVCFDELPDAARFFPFLTVLAQPAYDMGMNAAQLLLSRLTAERPLPPRQVVLPSRLILRYSCGRTLRRQPFEVEPEETAFSLERAGSQMQEVKRTPAQERLVKPLSLAEKRELFRYLAGLKITFPVLPHETPGIEKPDVRRLLQTLRHEEADRVPHLEIRIAIKGLYEYVLERALEPAPAPVGPLPVTIETQVEFAQRVGMDAVCVDFAWQSQVKAASSFDTQVPLAEQLSLFERYLRAVHGSGVGIFARFAFLDSDKLLRAICDRFSDDLAFILVDTQDFASPDQPVEGPGFQPVLSVQIERLIAPAKEHDKPVLLRAPVSRVDLLQLSSCGVDGIYLMEDIDPDLVFELKKRWAGKLSLLGTIPASLLQTGSPQEIEETIRVSCQTLAPGGGWVVGLSSGVQDGISPANYLAMTRAVHRYGCYRSLGTENQQNNRKSN